MAQLWSHFESSWLFKPTGGSPDVVHLIIYASTIFLSPFKATTVCPPKSVNFAYYALKVLFLAFWSALEEKVGWVLKSSGNFLSNKHKNIIILWRNCWEKWGKRCLPPLKFEKTSQKLLFWQKCFLCFRNFIDLQNSS